MPDYILREAAMQIVRDCGGTPEYGGALKEEYTVQSPVSRAVISAIKGLPAADVVPVKRSSWNDEDRCRLCGCYAGEDYERMATRTPFCPGCGAKMGKEQTV